MKIIKKLKEKIKANKNRFKIIIISAIIIMVFLTGYCLAKYQIEKNILANSGIATPVFMVEGTETTKISAINNIGYYDFIVKNYDDEKISDVPLKYSIEVIANTDESISFKLYNSEDEIKLENNKTEDIYIENSKEEEHKYRLEITYDRNKSTSEQDILEDVQIKVHSEQAKI